MEESKKGLSAGRVQSVALRLVIDRENEIRNFKPEEYWSIEGEFRYKNQSSLLNSYIIKQTVQIKNKKMLKNYIRIKW